MIRKWINRLLERKTSRTENVDASSTDIRDTIVPIQHLVTTVAKNVELFGVDVDRWPMYSMYELSDAFSRFGGIQDER